MATTPREKRTLLSHEELMLLHPSHYPAIKTLVPKDLRGLAARRIGSISQANKAAQARRDG